MLIRTSFAVPVNQNEERKLPVESGQTAPLGYVDTTKGSEHVNLPLAFSVLIESYPSTLASSLQTLPQCSCRDSRSRHHAHHCVWGLSSFLSDKQALTFKKAGSLPQPLRMRGVQQALVLSKLVCWTASRGRYSELC